MPRTKKTNTPNDIKQSNLQETVRYSNPKNYKILKYVDNPQLDELYQKWQIKPNNFSSKIDISKFMTEEVVPYNKYFDLNYESAWQNKLYNLKVPPNFNIIVLHIKILRMVNIYLQMMINLGTRFQLLLKKNIYLKLKL